MIELLVALPAGLVATALSFVFNLQTLGALLPVVCGYIADVIGLYLGFFLREWWRDIDWKMELAD